MSVQHHVSRRRRAAIGAAVGAAIAFAVAGCSSDESPSGTTAADSRAVSSPAGSSAPGQPSATHNDADVEFTTEMIAHHRQAVMMADLVEGRTQNPELIALADKIEDTQDDEIDQMAARLKSWGVPVNEHMDVDGDSDHGNMSPGGGGMDHGDMPGMMSAEQMVALRNASGAEFDRLWLEGMISHHEGAIAMADEVLANGTDPDTKDLATQVKTTQQAEIDQMRAMLGQG